MLQKYKTKREEGFTIIEVLIVLAIAGLILLIVFLAVPALQRNSRNNARNNEASRISAAITECLSNKNGEVSGCNDTNNSSGANIAVKLGIGTNNTSLTNFQQFTAVGFAAEPANPAQAVTGTTTTANIQFGRVCTATGDGTTTTGASTRDFTVTYQREPNVRRCIGSQ